MNKKYFYPIWARYADRDDVDLNGIAYLTPEEANIVAYALDCLNWRSVAGGGYCENCGIDYKNPTKTHVTEEALSFAKEYREAYGLDRIGEISSLIPVSKELPVPGALNPNTRDYQQYMCLVQISGKTCPDLRPLGFSEKERWVSGGNDMTDYVHGWMKNPEVFISTKASNQARREKLSGYLTELKEIAEELNEKGEGHETHIVFCEAVLLEGILQRLNEEDADE